MAALHEFFLSGDYNAAKALSVKVLENLGFTVTFTDEHNAIAERGSRGATVMLGAFAGKKKQHTKVSVQFLSTDNGLLALRLTRTTTGMAAGAIGVARANNAFAELVDEVGRALAHNNILVESRPVS